MVDTLVLGTSGEIRGSSSLPWGTIILRVVSSVGTSVWFTSRMSAVRARHDPPSLFGDWESLVNPSGLGPEDRRFESYISDHSFIPEYPSGSRGRTVNPLRNPPLVRIQPPEPVCWPIVKWLSPRILIPLFPVRVRMGLPQNRSLTQLDRVPVFETGS